MLNYYFAAYSYYILLIDLVILIIISIRGLALAINNPEILDNVCSYFCVKGLYLIKKDGGYVLYGYDFQNTTRNEFISQDQMLLGGFIQAVTTGLRVTLNVNGNIKVLQVGNEFIYFGHGKYLFGVAFSTEANPRIAARLKRFLDRFEDEYHVYLERWTGLLINFRSEIVERWLFKCFR